MLRLFTLKAVMELIQNLDCILFSSSGLWDYPKKAAVKLSYKLFLTTRNRGVRFVDCFISQEYVLKLSSVELWKLT